MSRSLLGGDLFYNNSACEKVVFQNVKGALEIFRHVRDIYLDRAIFVPYMTEYLESPFDILENNCFTS